MTYWDKPQKTTLSMRLTTDEKRAIQDAAAAAGETVSDFIRLCCQVVPSCYVAKCDVLETGETVTIQFSPDTVPRVGDHVTVFSDVMGCEASGVVESVTPIWETAETLRQRYETLIID